MNQPLETEPLRAQGSTPRVQSPSQLSPGGQKQSKAAMPEKYRPVGSTAQALQATIQKQLGNQTSFQKSLLFCFVLRWNPGLLRLLTTGLHFWPCNFSFLNKKNAQLSTAKLPELKAQQHEAQGAVPNWVLVSTYWVFRNQQ